jgi:hypothetical protein
MSRALRIRNAALLVIAVGFTVAFLAIVVPALLDDRPGGVIDAFAAGFVNPFSAGYSLDVLSCWVVLATWVIYEVRAYGVRGGWIALLLGVVPGVVVGLVAYLLIRESQLRTERVLA